MSNMKEGAVDAVGTASPYQNDAAPIGSATLIAGDELYTAESCPKRKNYMYRGDLRTYYSELLTTWGIYSYT
jgi:hypothetical protein